jgi:hypothetical protein
MMSEYKPVTTLDDLNSLDIQEVMDGYRDGRDGWPEPGNNHSRSYWHGWRNGAADGKHREIDQYQRELARVVVLDQRINRTAS